jgi:hypothetical protein
MIALATIQWGNVQRDVALRAGQHIQGWAALRLPGRRLCLDAAVALERQRQAGQPRSQGQASDDANGLLFHGAFS